MIELIITLAVISIMMGALAPLASQMQDAIGIRDTASDMDKISDGLIRFLENTGRFPEPREEDGNLPGDAGDDGALGLDDLAQLANAFGYSNYQGPYADLVLDDVNNTPLNLADDRLTDYWGMPYMYHDDIDTADPYTTNEIAVFYSVGTNNVDDSQNFDSTPSDGICDTMNNNFDFMPCGDDFRNVVTSVATGQEMIYRTQDRLTRVMTAYAQAKAIQFTVAAQWQVGNTVTFSIPNGTLWAGNNISNTVTSLNNTIISSIIHQNTNIHLLGWIAAPAIVNGGGGGGNSTITYTTVDPDIISLISTSDNLIMTYNNLDDVLTAYDQACPGGGTGDITATAILELTNFVGSAITDPWGNNFRWHSATRQFYSTGPDNGDNSCGQPTIQVGDIAL